MVPNKHLIVIVGPTAVGKTALAIKVAKYFGTEILSADSRQFYKEMSIGTAKPTEAELAEASHHFINSLSIHQEYTVGDYENEALRLLDNLFKSHQNAVLVGGSGLFVNAVTKGFDAVPKAHPEVREELNKLHQEHGLKALQKKLKELDPDYFTEVDLNNPQRIIRALEVSITYGKPFSSYRVSTVKNRPFRTIKIGLNMPREALYDRINARVDQMLELGLLDEARALLPFRSNNALNTVGYSEVFDYFEGKYSLQEAVDQIKQNTRRFAKRQLTWFRKDQEIEWFEPDQFPDIMNYINSRLPMPGQ